jgi:hypothetical protein
MTPEEFLKKWCYNGHDIHNCPKLADLKAVIEKAIWEHDHPKDCPE